MLNKAKEFYGDYKKMVVEPEKDFYRKHWVGVILINAVPITLFFMAPTICDSATQLKDKFTSKKKKNLKKKESGHGPAFDKHVDETLALFEQRS